MTGEGEVLWRPSEQRVKHSQMLRFQRWVAERFAIPVENYRELHHWSVRFPQLFWQEIVNFFPVIYSGENFACEGRPSFVPYSWFPRTKLNFAQNLLAHGQGDRVAITSLHESGGREQLTYRQLRESVAKLQGQLSEVVGPGDVVACYMPNTSETIVAMLATSAMGGIFTSTSCDFGVQGVVDRFGQTEPKVLIAARGYTYNGKYFDLRDKIAEIVSRIPSLKQVIVVDFLRRGDGPAISNAVDYARIMERDERHVSFVPMDFSSPLYIMYSSGTTGKPKCIVHSAGGTLLQHIKELGLHTDLSVEKKITYFTTCGWMMWNWLVSSLFFGPEVVLYEGAPHHPSLKDFVALLATEKINIFGTSPKLLRALEREVGENLGQDCSHLETILSTGAPLLPEQFDYVYRAFGPEVLLASICGGTDIVSCFMLGNPLLPVHRGEIQAPGLAMDVAALNAEGHPVTGERGELVCRTPFVSTPTGFWNDPEGEKFRRSYFARYPGVWHHGDFITFQEHQGIVVHGRSDSTLNPGGVRIGTAEIYRQTEAIPYIADSVCVAREREGDVEVVLFVQLTDGETLTSEKIREISERIRQHTSPRHVPRAIHAVTGIPYTRSGKKMELAVTRLINGRELDNLEAVANPEMLDQYRKRDELFG